MADNEKKSDWLSQLPYPSQPYTGAVGFLLDVSGSMRGPLEAGRAGEPAVKRLHAALRTVLKVAKAEQRQHPDARVFVGLFGLDSDGNPGCPTQIDLCSVIEALISDPSDRQSGHDLLVGLAKQNNRAHVEKYIRAKLTDDEARFLYVYLQQEGHESQIDKFIAGIPSDETIEKPGKQVRGAVQFVSTAAGSIFFGSSLTIFGSIRSLEPPSADSPGQPSAPPIIGLSSPLAARSTTSIETIGTGFGEMAGGLVDSAMDIAVGSTVDRSDALKLAHSICNGWLADFSSLAPRSIMDTVDLLTRLQGRMSDISDSCSDDASNKMDFLGALRRYLYGRTPMKHSLNEALKVFREFDQSTAGNHLLVLVSDGLSTDGNPNQILDEAPERRSNVTIATVFLTSNREAAPRRIYDKPLSAWEEDGRITLFNMASKVSVAAHPIPVLTTLGWQIPSSGEGALFATVCSASALEEFCSIIVSARFEFVDVLLDVLGRWNLDQYVEYEQGRTCNTPSKQSGPTCYAHAAAAAVYMALYRIIGRVEGYPTIREIRTRIMHEFPWHSSAWRFGDLLAALTSGYHPLHFQEVDETGARDAVLRRRPVLTTFFLSDDGWNMFEKHFETAETRKSTLEHEHMDEHRWKDPSNVGHAVVLIGCNPNSLTFLNSWGQSWGNDGLFSISDPTVLETGRHSHRMRFYDIFWLEEDLTDAQRAAYNAEVCRLFHTHSENYPSIMLLEARCPRCSQKAPIAKFTGGIQEAVCPNCKAKYKPEPDHILQAL
jgi:hypothetical protein